MCRLDLPRLVRFAALPPLIDQVSTLIYTETKPMPVGQPKDISGMRFILNNWPLSRGKGALMRVFQHRLRERDFLIEVEPGIFIPGTMEDYMVYWVFVNGYSSDHAVRLSRLLIRPGDTVFDIGANIGLWAMGAAFRASPSGTVYAFEPVPENVSRLRKNLELNRLDNVNCEMLALSDMEGTASLFKPSYDNSGHPTLGRRKLVEIEIKTHTTTLDSYCGQHGIHHVDFVKIDVEGAELMVFRGAQQLLSSPDSPAILFEVNEETAAILGSSSTMVKSLLAEHGYTSFRYDGKVFRVAPCEDREAPGDLFAFKAHHFDGYPAISQLVNI